jgi:hypothetical protein
VGSFKCAGLRLLWRANTMLRKRAIWRRCRGLRESGKGV